MGEPNPAPDPSAGPEAGPDAGPVPADDVDVARYPSDHPPTSDES